MGQAQHFEQGQNWKAKNAASIRLRVGDGQKHAVETRQVESQLTDEQRREAERKREEHRAGIAKQRQAQEARRRGDAREKRADDLTAERDHTPDGWKPANRRAYSDPLAQQNDPRRKADAEKRRDQQTRPRKPKKRRVIRPGS
jgi:hypothetical protein